MTSAPHELEDIVLEKPIMGRMLGQRLRLGDDFCCEQLAKLGANGDLAKDMCELLVRGLGASDTDEKLARAFIGRWPRFHLHVIRETLIQAHRCPDGPGGGRPFPPPPGGKFPPPPDRMPIDVSAEIRPGTSPTVTITLEAEAVRIHFTGPGTLKGLPR